MHPFFGGLLGLLALFTTTATAQATEPVSSNDTAPVFVYSTTEGASFVFAAVLDSDVGSISFHMSAPVDYAWMGVGIGAHMMGSLIFVVYPSADTKNVTISPRFASGHSEPTFTDTVVCTQQNTGLSNPNNITDDGMVNADATCTGLKSWSGWGAIDFTSNEQQFIFAVGPSDGPPGYNLATNSLSAGIPRHEGYGHFSMDFSAASNLSGVPAPTAEDGTYLMANAKMLGDLTEDHFPGPRIHAFVMTLVWVIIFPVGATLLRVMQKVLWHAACQAIGMVLFIMAAAGGIKISPLYNKSKHYTSGHQILGMLILIAAVCQFAFGLINHHKFKKTQQGTILGKIHRYLGPATMLLGLINGLVGFNFAGNARLCLPYAILMVVVAIVLFGVRMCVVRRRQKSLAAPAHAGQQQEGYQYPSFGSSGAPPAHSAPQYGSGPPPPSYDAGVPLAPYRSHSEQNVPVFNAQPTEPRAMV